MTREGIQRTWRLMFTTLPIICFDSDLEAMLAVRNSEDLYYQNPRKKTDGYIVIVDPLKRTDGEYVFSKTQNPAFVVRHRVDIVKNHSR